MIAYLVGVMAIPGHAAQIGHGYGVIAGFGSADGKPVRNTTARLRKTDTGEVASTSASDSSGVFAFVMVPAGTYIVELVCSGDVLIGTSAPVTITSEAPHARGISVDINASAAIAAGAATCVAPLSRASALLKSMGQPFTSALGIIVVGAAAASGVTGIVSTRNDTSASR
jgi:hypothetical protein